MSKDYTPKKEKDEEYLQLLNLKKEIEAQLAAVNVALRPYLYARPNVKKDEY